jgi:hypothetical protein
MAGGAGRPNSGDSGEGSGREIVGEGARAHLGLIGARVGVGRPATSAADGGGLAAAAAASIPARMPVLPSNPWLWRLWWRVVVASACTNGSPVAWRGKLTVGGHGDAVAACGAGRRGRVRAWGGLATFNRRWAAHLGADEDRPVHGFVSEGAHAQGQATDWRSKACDRRDVRQGWIPTRLGAQAAWGGRARLGKAWEWPSRQGGGGAACAARAARATRRGVALWRQNVSLCPCSSAISSRFWNRSAPKCE